MRRIALGLALSTLILQEPAPVYQSAIISRLNDSTYTVQYTKGKDTINFKGTLRGDQVELRSCARVKKVLKATMTFTTTLPKIQYQLPDTFKVEGFHVPTLDERTANPADSSYHYRAKIAEELELIGRTEDLGSFSHRWDGIVLRGADSVRFYWNLTTTVGLRCKR